MRTLLAMILLASGGRAERAFGTWKMNPARSTFTGGQRPESLRVRIEPHPHGEVFTLDQTERGGRATTSSTILYLDGKPRDFQDANCSGTQSSRRVDGETVEIIRKCSTGERTRVVRRWEAQPEALILDIAEQPPGGRRFERRLVLERNR